MTSCRPIPVVIVSDPGEDLDDEMTMVMLRYLTGKGFVDCKGVITNLRPATDRARLMRGTLDTLGLETVPVGLGTDGGSSRHTATFTTTAASFTPPEGSERAARVHSGRALLRRCFHEALDGSLALVCISSLKDAALFVRDNTVLFKQKIGCVVIMGGVQEFAATPGQEHCLVPDSAQNNAYDPAGSEYFMGVCQTLGVPLVVLARHAAYASPMPREIYDHMAHTGSPIAVRLRTAQRTSMEALWTRTAAPVGDHARMGLPPRCDRAWFQDTFCSGREVTRLRRTM
jgi:inosine-uridine nucleoside N-ribohydrolase